MGEIRIVGPGETRGYPYPVCKKPLYGLWETSMDNFEGWFKSDTKNPVVRYSSSCIFKANTSLLKMDFVCGFQQKKPYRKFL